MITEPDLPLSLAQERLWFFDAWAPDDPLYNELWLLRLTGPLDVELLGRALDRLAQRHESLRSTFPTVAGAPVCRHLPALCLAPAEVHDLTAMPAVVRETRARELAGAFADRRYELATGPLVRCGLIRLGASEHLLMIGCHHLVADGASLPIVMAELDKIMRMLALGETDGPPPPPARYADHAIGQRQALASGRLDGQLAYWREHLAGAPERLDLTAGRSRPAVKRTRGVQERFDLGPIGSEVVDLASREHTTVGCVLLTACAAVFHRWSGSEDMVVGTSSNGRAEERFERVVGFFTGVLPLRLRPDGRLPFRQLLDQVTDTVLDGLECQEAPFQTIVDQCVTRRSPSVPPLVQVMVVPEYRTTGGVPIGDLAAAEERVARGRARFDLLIEIRVDPDGLHAWIEYDDALFDADRIALLAADIGAVLATVPDRPDMTLTDLPIRGGAAAVEPDAGAPLETRDSEYHPTAPAALREALLDLWRRELHTPELTAHDDLFEHGGHSILAARLTMRMRDEFGIDVPVRRVFEYPTVAGLAAAVARDDPSAAEMFGLLAGLDDEQFERLLPDDDAGRDHDAAGPEDGSAPLTGAQRQIWVMEQLAPGQPTYNIPIEVALVGTVRVPSLRAAFDSVVERHEALRCVVRLEAGGPIQVAGAPQPELDVVDVRQLDPAAAVARGRRIAAEQAVRGFDLTREGGLRATLVRLDTDRSLLLLVFHHLAIDEVGLRAFSRDLVDAYAALCDGRAPVLPELPVTWTAYARWEWNWLRGEAGDRLRQYWYSQLHDAPELELPTELPPPRTLTFAGEHLALPASAELYQAVTTLARRLRATPFMVVTTACALLLGRLSGQDEFVIGAPTENRQHAGARGVVGCAVNVIALRIDLGGAPSFAELVDRVRTVTLDGYDHQGLPLPDVIQLIGARRRAQRLPLVQVTTAWQDSDALRWDLAGCSSRWRFVSSRASRYDISYTASHRAGGVELAAEYKSELWTTAGVERQLRAIERTLLDAAAELPPEPVAAGGSPALRAGPR